MIGECDSCKYVTELGRFERLERAKGRLVEKETYLCKICMSTLAGNAYLYPEQYENPHVLRTLAWIANEIIKTIKENKK